MGGCLVAAGIYEYRCKASGRVYRGSAKDLEERHSAHVRSKGNAGQRLSNEWEKYGTSNMEYRVLCNVELPDKSEASRVQLILHEQYAIDEIWPASTLTTAPANVLNLCPVAGTNLGYKFTDEQRANVGASHRGRVIPPEVRAKMSLAKRRAIALLTAEQRSAISRKAQASMTPEQRSERSRKATAKLTPEQRSANARRATAKLTPEQRSANARKAALALATSLTSEQRTASARHSMARFTHEQHRVRAGKASHAYWHVEKNKPCTCAPEVIAAYQQSHKLHAR
jgi:group I intron endonuclease